MAVQGIMTKLLMWLNIWSRIEVDQMFSRKQFERVLSVAAGQALETYEENSQLTRRINRARKALGCPLYFDSDGELIRVTLRCSPTTRSNAGNFQAVTTTSKRKVLYTGTTIPLLTSAIPSETPEN